MGSQEVVQAAGGVVARTRREKAQVLLIHRPDRDDWSLPKGKLDEGERHRDAAIREVEEETGLICRPVDRLPDVTYTDARGRPKCVRYWTMVICSGDPAPSRFEANDEVDRIGWFTLSDADDTLSYKRDRLLLQDATDLIGAAALIKEPK